MSTNSCPTLRAAIQAADNNPGSTIQLGAASYQLTSVKGALSITANMTIEGLGPSETTIDQKYSGAGVITVSSGTTVAISGVSITGGRIQGAAGTSGSTTGGGADGGGISNTGTLTLTDDSVASNSVTGGNAFTGGSGGRASGGGVANTGTLTLTGDEISNDSATGGAGSTSHGGGQGVGGGVDSTGTLTVIDSAFSNDAGAGGTGGGGFNGGAFGGAIEQSGGKLTVERSTIGPANRAGTGGNGGGIDSESATTKIVNSTIFGNTAGVGGGLSTSADVSTSLASDTFDANTSQYGGGNIFNSTSGAIELSNTIIAAGAGPNATRNCDDEAGAFVDGGHNLETDATSQCGLGGAGKSDLLVSSAFLPSALDANGGLTDTLALLPGAPEIGAGGDCVDPSQTPPTTTLSVDQRGLPRPLAPATCDIGAFQTQLPANTVPPKLSGVAQVGQALSCTPGTWTGDGPLNASGAVGALSYSYQWLRGAVAIMGATASSYTAQTADVGQQLSCKVTATGAYGHASAASAASAPTTTVTVPPTPPPPQTTRAKVDNQQITLVTPSLRACTASGKKLGVTLNSATIAHSKATKLKFSSARFYLDKGVKHTHKKTITSRTGRRKHVIVTSYSANTTAHHVPVTLELSIRALKPGIHTLTVKLSYKKREKRHGHEITVTVTKTLKVKFKVC